MQNLMQIHCSAHSVTLNVMATQYTCSLYDIYHLHWLLHWSNHCSCMSFPAHSLWLPDYIHVSQTILITLTMAELFPDRPHILEGVVMLLLGVQQGQAAHLSKEKIAWIWATYQWSRFELSIFHAPIQWTTIAVKVLQEEMFLIFSISWNKTPEKPVPKKQHNLEQWMKSLETVFRKLCYLSRIEVFKGCKEWGDSLQVLLPWSHAYPAMVNSTMFFDIA